MHLRTPGRLARPYTKILRLPGAVRFCATGALMRMPMSMMGVGIVVGYAAASGSYASAGSLAACHMVSAAVAAPLLGRAIDAHGQRRIAAPAMATHCTAALLLAGGIALGAPLALLAVFAIATGGSYGSLGPLVRARWHAAIASAAKELPNPEQALDTAFALESMIDEVVFVVGPVVVVALATQVAPAAGIAFSAICGALGAAGFLTHATSEPAPRAPTSQSSIRSVLGATWPLALAAAALGAVFGSLEVATVAVSEAAGRPELAGATLACFSFGSLLSAGAYGLLPVSGVPAVRRLRWALLGLALTATCVPLVDHTMWLAVGALTCGAAIGPSLIALVSATKMRTPDGALTQGFAWNSMMLGSGLAAGTAATGVLVDHAGASWGFWLTCGLAWCAWMLGWMTRLRYGQ